MRFPRILFASLVLLGALPATADASLTNRTRADVRVDLKEVNPNRGSLILIVHPPLAPGAPRPAWGAQENAGNGAGPVIHGIYDKDVKFTRNRINLPPGATLLILAGYRERKETHTQCASFTVARVRPSGTTPPQEVTYFRLIADNPDVREELTLLPEISASLGFVTGPLYLVPQEQGGAHYDLKDEADSFCAIL